MLRICGIEGFSMVAYYVMTPRNLFHGTFSPAVTDSVNVSCGAATVSGWMICWMKTTIIERRKGFGSLRYDVGYNVSLSCHSFYSLSFFSPWFSFNRDIFHLITVFARCTKSL